MSSSTSSSPSSSSPFTIAQFPCLDDNYGYLIHDETTGQTAAIDTPCAKTYQTHLDRRGWTLTHILNTHHHHDHTGGNQELKERNSHNNNSNNDSNSNNIVTIYGPANEADRIPGLDVALGGGDTLPFGSSSSTSIAVMDVGGHTKGHIAFHIPSQNVVFVGDALFALGCGKMFEGTPEQFWKSLKALRELSDETTVYCAHEYTSGNAKFALSVEPGNTELQTRALQIREARSKGLPTVPTTMGLEKRTNPFLRVDISDEIRDRVGIRGDDDEATAFGKLRRAKDCFR